MSRRICPWASPVTIEILSMLPVFGSYSKPVLGCINTDYRIFVIQVSFRLSSATVPKGSAQDAAPSNHRAGVLLLRWVGRKHF